MYDVVSEAILDIGKIFKSLLAQSCDRERSHDSLQTVQSLLQVCVHAVNLRELLKYCWICSGSRYFFGVYNWQQQWLKQLVETSAKYLTIPLFHFKFGLNWEPPPSSCSMSYRNKAILGDSKSSIDCGSRGLVL